MTTAGRVAEWEPGGTHPDLPRLRPRRRRHRVRRAAGWLGGACIVILAAAAAGYLATPSASSAAALVRSQDARDHVSDPSAPVPAQFSGALVATEDHRFYSEPGIDPVALARVVAGAVTGRADQGGSTLSVQLAKMLYTPRSDGLPAKAEQAVLAVKLNMRYSKAAILRMYANVVYFGGGYYGLDAASCGYFGVRPGALSLGQAAVLAGLVQAPSAYDPRLHPVQARQREQHVLDRMAATGLISARAAKAAGAGPLRLNTAGSGCR